MQSFELLPGDTKVYGTFQFAKFFRKNVTLMSSVIPDPGKTSPGCSMGKAPHENGVK